MFQCSVCHCTFNTQRGLSTHYNRQIDCRSKLKQVPVQLDIESRQLDNNLSNIHDQVDYNDMLSNCNFDSVDNNTIQSISSCCNELNVQYHQHSNSGYMNTYENKKIHIICIQLLHILKSANAPLYLYDSIIKWAKNSASNHEINFMLDKIPNRKQVLIDLAKMYNIAGLNPVVKCIQLTGSGQQVNIVCHSFKQCLYSLFSDKNLMHESNLLITKDDPYSKNKFNQKMYVIDDIDTGTVYKQAYNAYIKPDTLEVLLPIIFFIDKTHIDTHGRWCLEQIRFTLGIFNRSTRNLAKAWRTIGYIPDKQNIKTVNAIQGYIDYHQMIKVILEEFNDCQDQKIAWNVCLDDKEYPMHFITRILFIIGDSEGHDKLASRYLCRNNVARLCRYCDCPFDQTSNPYFKSKYNIHKEIFAQINKSDNPSIQELSMYQTNNAFEYLKFCDQKRGLFGSLCADILHCLQLGLFKYFLDKIFDQNKESKASQKKRTGEILDVSDITYTQFKVFSPVYSKKFDKLVKKYGKMLSRQSDRDLPRTNVNTDIQSNAKKNGHEMSGILINLLIIFSSEEGTNELDTAMAEEQSTNIIHLIELLLMLEDFCLSDNHTKAEVYKFQDFLPMLLDKFKTVVDRKIGNKLNVLKFHLPVHFADDILRFGVMKNFDSSIGESHHKIDAKKPGKNTQKRKDKFELQTAIRQLENLTISICYDTIEKNNDDSNTKIDIQDDDVSKWYRYIYNRDKGLCFFKQNSKKTILLPCV